MGEGHRSFPQLDVRTLPGPKTIKRRELPNGVVVLARTNFASPSVVVSGYLTVGSLDESRDQAGLSQLTAQALMRGTRVRSFQEIFEAIESIGASLGFGAGTHTTTFQGKALIEDLELLLEVLANALRYPTFPSVEVERLKAQHLTSLAIRDQSTGAKAQISFDELAYPNHPYRIPTAGYRETVSGLMPSDPRVFHGKHFGPSGMVIAVVGSVEEETAVDAVERVLGDWRNPETDRRTPLPHVESPGSLLRQDVHLAGKSQADLVIGTPGPSRFEDHYLAAALGNNILGRFGLFGRIGDAVRDSAGLAYYAYSSLAGGPGPGPWQVNAGVDPANVERAIELIRKEIKRFVSRRVTEEELTDNQANFIGRLPLQLESNEGVAGAMLHMERYSLGLDYYQRYPDLIASITRDQVLEIGKRFLNPDRLAVAVAGPVHEA